MRKLRSCCASAKFCRGPTWVFGLKLLRVVSVGNLIAMEAGTHWLLWQLADSAFPLGGFAHSAGLEAALQQGLIERSDEAAEILRSLVGRAAFGDLPLVNAVLADPDRLDAVQRRAGAMLLNPVARRASLAQGRALIRVAAGTFPGVGAPPPNGDGPLHFAPAFGWLMHRLTVKPDAARRLFLYITARAGVSAAIRLNLTGPLAGQAMLHALGPEVDRLATATATLGLDDAAATCPLLDLAHANHDRLYSRLFQS